MAAKPGEILAGRAKASIISSNFSAENCTTSPKASTRSASLRAAPITNGVSLSPAVFAARESNSSVSKSSRASKRRVLVRVPTTSA